MLFSLKAHACVMSSPALRYSQKAPAGRACSNAWAKRKRKWAKQVWLIGKKKSRLQNSQFFFLKIGLAWLSLARGAQASHACLSPVSLSVFNLASDLTARACLNSQKYGLFCGLEKVNQSINQSIRLSIYLYLTLLILAESLQQQQVWQKRFVYLGEVIGNLDWIGS